MIGEAVDISLIPIATQVHRMVLARFYEIQLTEIQEILQRFGYFFAKTDAVTVLPPALFDRVARDVDYRRKSYLYPQATTQRRHEWTRVEMLDGYAQQYLADILDALAALGLRLQETPETLALVTDWETRQREETNRAKATLDEIFQDILTRKGAIGES